MCVNLKLKVNKRGVYVVSVLTLSCPAVSQIRNLCSSFPHGTVLVRNDALQDDKEHFTTMLLRIFFTKKKEAQETNEYKSAGNK